MIETLEADPKVSESAIPANPVEALDKATAPASSKPTAAEQRARDDQGRFAAREKKEKEVAAQLAQEFPDLFPRRGEQGEQPKASSDKGQAEGSKETKPTETAVSAEPTQRQVDKANAILDRAQISKERRANLSQAEIVAWGKDLKPMVISLQQAAQKANVPNPSTAIAAPAQPGSQAGEPHDSPALNLKDAVKDFEKDYGPEFAATLEKALRAAVGPLQAKLDKAEAKASKDGEAQLKVRVDEAREALGERFPDLEDQDIFDEDVLPFMLGLHQTGRYDMTDPKQVEKLLMQAARAAELDEVQPQAKADKENLTRLRTNGTATSRSKPISTPGMTKDERIALAAKLAMDTTVPIEEARRRVHGS